MHITYLTTAELADRIKYDERTIRDQMKDSVLLEGIALNLSLDMALAAVTEFPQCIDDHDDGSA